MAELSGKIEGCLQGCASDILKMDVPDLTESEKAALRAIEAIHDRSFSGRHRELGKMIKCGACGMRHRRSECHMTREWKAKLKLLKEQNE